MKNDVDHGEDVKLPVDDEGVVDDDTMKSMDKKAEDESMDGGMTSSIGKVADDGVEIVDTNSVEVDQSSSEEDENEVNVTENKDASSAQEEAEEALKLAAAALEALDGVEQVEQGKLN